MEAARESENREEVHKVPRGGLLWEGVPGGALAQGAQQALQVPGWDQEGQTLRAQKGHV